MDRETSHADPIAWRVEWRRPAGCPLGDGPVPPPVAAYPPAGDRWPLWARMVVIAALAVASWAVLVAAIVAAVRVAEWLAK